MRDDKRCKLILKNGEQCKAWALKGKDLCFSHDPENKEAKLMAVTKGGLAKNIEIDKPLEAVSINKPKDVITLLEKTINEVREGKIDIRIATAIGYLSGQLMRAFETGDLEVKVEEVRAILIQRRTLRKVIDNG